MNLHCGTEFEVNLQNGAVRLPISWDSPAQHFALVGDVLLRIKSEGSKMAFENLGGNHSDSFRVFGIRWVNTH